MCVSLFMFKQICVIDVNIFGILWFRWYNVTYMFLKYTFADSSMQHSQMKQEIKLHDNILQEQLLYLKATTLIWKRVNASLELSLSSV